MAKNSTAEKTRKKIFALAKKYYAAVHGHKQNFKPGDKIGYGGRVFDEKEILNLIDSSLEFWLTTGRFSARFEEQFAKLLGVKYCSLVNSGSSANLLAFMALTSQKLGKRQIKPGDEVITVAAGFPTTIAPIVQYGAVPVFVDITLPTYNIDCAKLEKALSKKTRAVMVAHTLGNPFDLKAVQAFCEKHGLWLIEDNCDSLGSKYKYNGKWQYTGTFGDIATSSFYPPHHMSCSGSTAIPYLNEKGQWRLDQIEKIYGKYADKPESIKILSFDNENNVSWIKPAAILRHKPGFKKMLKITCQHGRSVEVTEDHSVFVLDQVTAKILPKSAATIDPHDFIVVTNEIPDPQKVGFIDIIDHFRTKDAYVSGFSFENLKNVESSDYRWQYKDRDTLPIQYLTKYDLAKEKLMVGISQSHKIPMRIPINDKLCRLLGYFIAEGSYQDGLLFSFNKNEEDLIADVKGIIKSLFGLPVVVRVKNSAAVVKVQSKNLEIVFLEIFGIKRGARHKRIPWFLYHCDESCVKSFVYGYTRGDGSIRRRPHKTNHIDVTSVSHDLLNDFQYLLSRIGISASFHRRNRGGTKNIGGRTSTGRDNYSLAFGGYIYRNKSIIKKNTKERNNFALQIPLLNIFRKYISIAKGQKVISRRRLAKYIAAKREFRLLVNGNLGFYKVRKVEPIRSYRNDFVYDFSVPGRENFYGGFLGMFLHNTMGEGGAVYTDNLQLKRIVESLRDWGRDCWCASGRDNTCQNRFGQQFGELPTGYDHKYVYSHLGYNLKVTDMQAAVGCAQLEKLLAFIVTRKANWKFLRTALSGLSKYFILPDPTANSDPSWFGFLLTVKETAGFTREAIVNHLESKGIQTRMLFAGNLLKHPCFDEMRKKGRGYRVVGDLKNTDAVMHRTFWIGVYPGMSRAQLEYMAKTIKDFVKNCA